MKTIAVLFALLLGVVFGQDADVVGPPPITGPIATLNPGGWAGTCRAAGLDVTSSRFQDLRVPDGDVIYRGDAWTLPGDRWCHVYPGWPDYSLCVHDGSSSILGRVAAPGMGLSYPMEGSRWVDGIGLVVLSAACWTGCNPTGWHGSVTVWDGFSSQVRTYPMEDTEPVAVELLPGNRLAVLDGYAYSWEPREPGQGDPPTQVMVLDLHSGEWSRAPGPILQWPTALVVHGRELWVAASGWKWPGGAWSWFRTLHGFDSVTMEYLGIRTVIQEPGPCGDVLLRGFGRRPKDDHLYARSLTSAWRFDAAGVVDGCAYVAPAGCGFWGPYQIEYEPDADLFVGQVSIATGYGPYYLWLLDPEMRGIYELQGVPDQIGRISGRR